MPGHGPPPPGAPAPTTAPAQPVRTSPPMDSSGGTPRPAAAASTPSVREAASSHHITEQELKDLDYRKEFVMVKLDFPIDVSGVRTTDLKVRRPKFRDRKRVMATVTDNDAEREGVMIALLTDLQPGDVEQLDDVDFRRISKVISSFLPQDMRS